MITIAIANRKGGVGKTTIACAAATKLAETHRVLLVDLDSQGSLTESMGLDLSRNVAGWLAVEGRPQVEHAHGVDVVTGGPGTARITLVVSGNVDVLNIQRALIPVQDEYDVTILDCPPTWGDITQAAVFGADWVLCPTLCEHLSVAGVRQLIAQAGTMAKSSDSHVKLMGVQPNQVRVRTNEHKMNLRAMVKAWGAWGYNGGGLVWPPLRQSIAVSTASAEGCPVWQYLEGETLQDWLDFVERVREYV